MDGHYRQGQFRACSEIREDMRGLEGGRRDWGQQNGRDKGKTMDPNDLPDELWYRILLEASHCSYRDLMRIAATSRSLRRLVDSEGSLHESIVLPKGTELESSLKACLTKRLSSIRSFRATDLRRSERSNFMSVLVAQLKVLHLENCEFVDDRFVSALHYHATELEDLTLKRCSKLQHVVVSFPKLNRLNLAGNEMKLFVTASDRSTLPHLKFLSLADGTLTELWTKSDTFLSQVLNPVVFCFELRELDLCGNTIPVEAASIDLLYNAGEPLSVLVREFPSLQILSISDVTVEDGGVDLADCPSLETLNADRVTNMEYIKLPKTLRIASLAYNHSLHTVYSHEHTKLLGFDLITGYESPLVIFTN